MLLLRKHLVGLCKLGLSGLQLRIEGIYNLCVLVLGSLDVG